MGKIVAHCGDRPRLSGRRRFPRAGHRLAMPTGVGIWLRRPIAERVSGMTSSLVIPERAMAICNIPDADHIGGLLPAHNKTPTEAGGFIGALGGDRTRDLGLKRPLLYH